MLTESSYEFIIDGQWCCHLELLPDASRACCAPNTFGTMNFAVDVGMDET